MASLTLADIGRRMDPNGKIADMAAQYWANFARTGNPNGAGLPKWESFAENPDKVFEIVALQRITAGENDERRTHRRHVIDESLPLLQRQLARIAPVFRRRAAVLAGGRTSTGDFPDQEQRSLVVIEFPVHRSAI